MFDDYLRRSATALVRGRGRSLGGNLTRLAKVHAHATVEDLVAALHDVSKQDKPAIGLLLARVLLDEALSQNSRILLNDFLFRYGAHLRTSVSTPGLTPAQRLVLTAAAEEAFQAVPTVRPGLLASISEMKLRLSGPVLQDADWRGVMGMNQAEYHDAIEALKVQVRGVRRATTAKTTAPQRRAEPTTRGLTQPASRTDAAGLPAVPAWLRAEFSPEADPLVTATANWNSDHFQSQTSLDVESAWQCFVAGDYSGARLHMGGLLASLGLHWGPTNSADSLRTWHWIRLVVELAALEAGEVLDRRRSAVSALELAQRCLPDEVDLLDDLRADALDDFAASDLATTRAWCAYTSRAIACSNHEAALADYANDEKAALRRSWQTQFSLSDDEARSTVAMATTVAPRLKTLLRRLYASARDRSDTLRVLREVRRDLPPFLDETEGQILEETLELALDSKQAIEAEALNHHDLRDQTAALTEMNRVIATSGSLTLQDYVAPHLAALMLEIEQAEHKLGDISRPEVSVRLESARLPFSAATGTAYAIRLIAANTGNATAERVMVRILQSDLGIDASATLADLGAGAEECVELFAAATGLAQAAVSLTCKLSWSDALMQQFTAEQTLAAEDQKPASWTPTDVNPFSLGTISDPARLVGREEDLNSLQALLAGGGSAYVTGHKRVGKTSLTRVLLENTRRERDWSGEVMPLGRALGPEQLGADLVYALLDEILGAVTESYGEAASNLNPVESEPSGNFARAANRWLRQVARTLPPEARVVIAIDDFDELPPHLISGPEADALFLFLRSLVDERWLNLIVVGSEVLPTIIQGQAHKLNQVVPVSVSNFSTRASTAALLVTPTTDRLEWDSAAIDRLHYLCRGNPYYETLVAHQLWDDLRERTRSYVTLADVDAAALSVARNAPSSHFVHLWADSAKGLDHTSRSAIVTSAVLRAVARCGGPQMAAADSDEVVRIAQAWIQTATAEELHQVINSLVTREVLERGPSETSLLMRIPLVSIWLTQAGGRALDAEYAASVHATATVRVVTETDLVALSRGLFYRGEHVSEIRIQAWLKQFGDHYHQYLAYRMLRRMVGDGYFTAARLHETVMPRLRENVASLSATRLILRDKNQYLKNAYLLDHGVAGDSTQGTISSLCKTLKIKKANVLSAVDMPSKLRVSDAGVVIFALDDFSGSGQHLTNALNELLSVLPRVADDWEEKVHIVVGAGVVAETSRLPASPGQVTVEHVAGMTLGARFRAFSPESGVFETDKEREDASDLVTTIGRSLMPNNSLGFGQDALLALLEFNCPNNAAPIFWRRGTYAGRSWEPLFERAF